MSPIRWSDDARRALRGETTEPELHRVQGAATAGSPDDTTRAWHNYARPGEPPSPRAVLDMHADLQRLMASIPGDPFLRMVMTRYALADAQVSTWAASHLYPSKSTDNLEPWLKSLGRYLYAANTYQCTAEMIDLATAMMATQPDLSDLLEEDIPAESGFMWLDKPIPRPSVEDEEGQAPLLMHAVSWTKVGDIEIRVRFDPADEQEQRLIHQTPWRGGHPEEPVFEAIMPAVCVREWGYNDNRGIAPRPLHLIGQNTAVLQQGVHTPLPEMALVHMLWILMGMEIAVTHTVQPDSHGRKRAANLAHRYVRVVQLRRAAPGEPTGNRREVDWSCTWLVRAHDRHKERQDHRAVAEHPNGPCAACGGDTIRIRDYIKGPQGLPLRGSDLLYKLSR